MISTVKALPNYRTLPKKLKEDWKKDLEKINTKYQQKL